MDVLNKLSTQTKRRGFSEAKDRTWGAFRLKREHYWSKYFTIRTSGNKGFEETFMTNGVEAWLLFLKKTSHSNSSSESNQRMRNEFDVNWCTRYMGFDSDGKLMIGGVRCKRSSWLHCDYFTQRLGQQDSFQSMHKPQYVHPTPTLMPKPVKPEAIKIKASVFRPRPANTTENESWSPSPARESKLV